MPVNCTIWIEPIAKEEFQKLDYQVMRQAFDCHNEIGNLADERVYQADLSVRLAHAGFQVDREAKIDLVHKTFQKSLFLDLVVDQRAVYELKRARGITDAHRGQLLSYLYLLELERGKILGFGRDRVQSEFINAAVPNGERKGFAIEHARYHGPALFLKMIVDLVRDWGTCLIAGLYHEAVVALLGGADVVEAMLPMKRGEMNIGTQRFYLLAPEDAFQLTAITKRDSGYEKQLQRLIIASPLQRMHWVNIGRHELQFVTFQR